MIHYKVYYDYYEGERVPFWLIIDAKASEIDWDQDSLLVPAQAPFELHDQDDFDQYAMNVSVILNELMLNVAPNHFSINLKSLKTRLAEFGAEPWEVHNLVVLVADIEEVLQMNVFH